MNPYNPPETVAQTQKRWLERPLSLGAKLFLVGLGMFLPIALIVLVWIATTTADIS